MAVACPYCGHRMRLKGARVGKFMPVCDRCRKKFMLIIAADPGVLPMVLALEEDRRAIEERGKSHP